MKLLLVFSNVILLIKLGVTFSARDADNLHIEGHVGWSYDPYSNPNCEGTETSKCGVSDWSRVTVPAATNMCASQSQSPINIQATMLVNSLSRALGTFSELLTGPSDDLVMSSTALCKGWNQYVDGHGFMVSFSEPNEATTNQCDTLNTTYLGKQYVMKNLHIHTPSEHTINGQHYDAEIHLVHKNADGELFVFAVFLDVRTMNNLRGHAHSLLTNFFEKSMNVTTPCNHSTTPYDILKDVEVSDEIGINPYNQLIGNNKNYYTYSGSLTVYPCTEAVQWIVFEQPTDITSEDLELLKKSISLYPDTIISPTGTNNRPIQPLNDRTISYKTAVMI